MYIKYHNFDTMKLMKIKDHEFVKKKNASEVLKTLFYAD